MNKFEEAKIIIDKFVKIDANDFNYELLDELAALLAEDTESLKILHYLLNSLEGVTEKKKREGIVISVFELLAEPPVLGVWLTILPFLLQDSSLFWILIRTYEYNTKDLITHMKLIQKE